MPVSVLCDTAAVTAAIRDSISTSSTNGSCSGVNDDSQSLQSKLVASAKRVLLSKIEYEEVNNYSQSVLDTLKSKYIVLKPSNSAKLNHSNPNDKDSNQIQSNALPGPRDPNQLPQPKRVLFARENVQIGWKSSGRKWQVGAGMLNVGNTCYLNSTLQALCHVPAMANWLMSDSAHREKCEDENGSQGGCIICAMSKTLISSQTSQSPIRPYLVYTKLRMVCKHLIMGRQEDAHEFLRYLVEAMEKSYLSRFRNSKELEQYSKETTPLNQILGGYLKSAVRCLACGHVSTTFQHFQDVLLDIRKANTIEEALEGYFARERLEDMGYKCEACKKKVSATKQFSLERAPISLCIQLKRFSMMGSKLNKHVGIRPRLDLTPYASKTNKDQLTYKLVAMVTHLGASQHCGHYTAIGLTDSGAYYQFDDSYVRPISIQNVLNTNAYIIFYELEDNHQYSRQTSTQISREHNEIVKESSNKINIHTLGNENNQQRPHSTTSTNNSNSLNPNAKLISKLEANNSVTLIGPQLPGKSIQRNASNSTIASSETSKSCQNGQTNNTNNKLVNSANPFKPNNGNNNVLGSFQSPNQKCNQVVGSKLMINFKNGNSNTSYKNPFSNTSKQQAADGSKFQSNSTKPGNRFESNGNAHCDNDLSNNNKPTLPSMPNLELSTIKEKQTQALNGYVHATVKSNSIEKKQPINGFMKPPQNAGNSNNIKSLVPYGSDIDSDHSNDELPKDKDCIIHPKSKHKRPYDNGNETPSSSSFGVPQAPKIRLSPPSPPIVKTKAGLWQVTDIVQPTAITNDNNSLRKNPFSSGSPTVSASPANGFGNKFNGKEKKFTNKKYNNEQPENETVQQLLKFSHRGYGAPVLTWNGQKPNMEKEVSEEIRQDRKRDFLDDEENDIDRGRQKKIKGNGNVGGRNNPGYNPFQEYQHNHQNQHSRWNGGGQYRPYRQYNHQNNHRNNFRRNNFYKRQPHQRNGNSFHHQRES